MRSFAVPFNIDSEDKIIGGYISLRQFAWICLGIFVTLLLLVVNKHYISVIDGAVKLNILLFSIRLLIALVVDIICGLFAFLKITGVSLDFYVIKMIKFKLRKHVIKN